MYQLYINLGNGNKWTEGFNSYNEAVERIVAMKTELCDLPFFSLSIIGPNGTLIQNVSNQ